MLGNPTGSRLTASAALAVVAVVAALVLPAPAYAADRQRAESTYDTTSPKTATARCPDGEVVIGAGGRIKDGNAGVRLDAVIPGRTSVTVRGEAFSDHEGAWSVIAAAVCAPESDGLSEVVTIESGSPTATCPRGTDLSGAGFDLPSGSVLTGLIPDASDDSVTVRTPMIIIGGGPMIAYAVCVPQARPSYTKRFEATSPVDESAPKTVTVGKEFEYEVPEMSGVGGEVTWVDSSPGPVQPIRQDVFIDTLMPSVDLTTVIVQAVDRSPVPGSLPAFGRVGGAAVADPDDEQWSVTGYGVNAYYY